MSRSLPVSFPTTDDEAFVREVETLRELEDVRVSLTTTEFSLDDGQRTDRTAVVRWDSDADPGHDEDVLEALRRLRAAGVSVRLTTRVTARREKYHAEAWWITHNPDAALLGTPAPVLPEEATS